MLVSPPWGNPGSATVMIGIYITISLILVTILVVVTDLCGKWSNKKKENSQINFVIVDDKLGGVLLGKTITLEFPLN